MFCFRTRDALFLDVKVRPILMKTPLKIKRKRLSDGALKLRGVKGHYEIIPN